MRILVCDDDRVIRYLLTVVLGKRHGFEIIEVESSSDVIEEAKATGPDLIVLDYTMPGMSGAEVATSIKADHMVNHIPVVFLTGRSDIAEDTLEESGVAGIIEKPFDTATLADRLMGFVNAQV